MVKEEKYSRFLVEAKQTVIEYQIKAISLLDRGFDCSPTIQESSKLQDAIDFVESGTYSIEDHRLMEFIDIMCSTFSLVRVGIII